MYGQQLAQLTRRTLGITFAIQRHGQVEAIIGLIGVGLHGLFEVAVRSVLAATRRDHAQIIEDLSKRQPRGESTERTLRFLHVSGIERGQAKIKLGFVGVGIAGGNARKPARRGLIVARFVITLAQLQNGQCVGRLQTHHFLEEPDLFLLAGGRDAAEVILQNF